MKNLTAFFIISIICMGVLSFTLKAKLSVDGVWKLAEVVTVDKTGKATSTFPKESQVIFTHGYYSFCWTSNVTTTHTWSMADSIKLNRFNQTLVNTGTYELNGSMLTTKAVMAMNPMFVNGEAKFNCSFSGDTLILTGLSVDSPDKIPNPLYAAGSHIVSKLVRVSK